LERTVAHSLTLPVCPNGPGWSRVLVEFVKAVEGVEGVEATEPSLCICEVMMKKEGRGGRWRKGDYEGD
jgi:hypothetical protein